MDDFLEYSEPTKIQKLKVIDKISFDDFKHYLTTWRTQTQVKILIQGNIKKDVALELSKSTLEILKLQKNEEVCREI